MHVLLALLSTTSTASAYCQPAGQTAFFATFGDNTQVDDGANTVDDAANPLYAMPATYLNFAQLQWGNGIARTDQIIVDAAHPVVLQGYTPFDYKDTQYAFLRFDIYYIGYGTDALSIWDDSFTQFLLTFDFWDPLTDMLRRSGDTNPHWVSIRLDMLTGNAFAADIDAFGNPIKDYGQFTTFGNNKYDSGSLADALKEASDGVFYPEIYDDSPVSYVAFYGMTNGWCN